MFILAFLLTFLILSRGRIRRSNDILGNDGDQFPAMSQETYYLSNYNITFWIRHLQVEHYAFLENRDYFYTVFLELDDSSFITKIINSYYAIKLFFQLYNCSIFNFENLCSLKLTEFKKFNYMLAEGTLGHQRIGPKARMASFDSIIFPYPSKKQKQHSRKEKIKIRSVTEECEEDEPTEEPQYYDYEENGHEASLGIIHKTKTEHFIRLIIIFILIICCI
ncbi:hypothetical protein M0802_009112 [Mischocyttarus mexicanus]|nr:hypothetical protein M0802_009112 [Mischocyttarus mexicanus]